MQKNSNEEEEIFKIDYRKFIELNFEFKEMLIIFLLLDGYNVSEISERNALSRVHTTRLIKGIRKKFKKYYRFK